MTARNFASDNRHWFGVVTNVMDPDQDGRVQVRIHGIHDDETNIPNNMLSWAKVGQDITSAAHNKIGGTPVGMVVGSTVYGIFLDDDQQYPMVLHTISKAGDAATSATSNGSETLTPGTNSTPPGGRLTTNAVITRSLENIKTDDGTQVTYPKYTPKEQNDSDGKDVTAEALAKTQFSKNPTVASNQSPTGSILTQMQAIDPSNVNAFLKQAIPNFIKIEALNTFGSTGGSTNVLGQALGMVFSTLSNQLGAATVVNALGSAVAGGNPSTTTAQALYTALTQMNQPLTVSSPILAVIEQSLPSLTIQITNLINTNSLTLTALENLILSYLQEIQANGMSASLGSGATPSNILNVIGSLLPTISSAINGTISSHLPKSVLNNSAITQALQKFATNQAFLKTPENGKKALAISAVQSSGIIMNGQISTVLNGINGISQTAATALTKLF